jgi:hypothetical protein
MAQVPDIKEDTVITETTETPFTEYLKKKLAEDNDYYLKVVVESLIGQAAAGDIKAAALIMDRIDGKNVDKVQLSGELTTKQYVQDSVELLKNIRKIQVPTVH